MQLLFQFPNITNGPVRMVHRHCDGSVTYTAGNSNCLTRELFFYLTSDLVEYAPDIYCDKPTFSPSFHLCCCD